ncbi:MAG: transcription elongation factor GreAB [Betaproteobacteria bacterium HGW-Betaproteobacteria-1]|jgi:regulator of nucleoside diphosphate kinase|nr:MAG: transcription elongation factor GreAB [Betaproteobacteria bacterium HGW-Betaproteobacteria-1]
MKNEVLPKGKIQVTSYDMNRLFAMTEQLRKRSGPEPVGLDHLEEELARCAEVSQETVPADVVTMNSRVTLKDLTSGKEITCTLVFPDDADSTQGRVSILAPLGMAILGYRVGDKISWQMPSGVHELQIEAVHYQPEAAGDFQL